MGTFILFPNLIIRGVTTPSFVPILLHYAASSEWTSRTRGDRKCARITPLLYWTAPIICHEQFNDGYSYSKGKLEAAFRPGGILEHPYNAKTAAGKVSGATDPKEKPTIKKEDLDVIVSPGGAY